MVKMGKLVHKFENLFFWDGIPGKMVKEITFLKNFRNYRSKQILFQKNSSHSAQ
jgi:hypothetical protein